ncbi:PDZ domain-containing protein [Sphingomonas hylomeconis]|uniref:PDZ domain-containing protein n=1 Tax=Sphingomonas hylomeconis TaxID=1395958 RepID=A0ABV7SZT7_9SPHN|nr:hypothetical protein [Sphingomonas hylomeconis]
MPRTLRRVWLALLLLVAAIQLAGFAFVLFDAYRINPALHAIGIEIEFDDDARPVVAPLRADIVAAGVARGDRIVAIAGRRYAPGASAATLARAIIAAPGDRVALRLRKPDGREITLRASRSARAASIPPRNAVPLNIRMGVRLFFTLLCSLSLLGSSFVLLHRRPRDPEALLLGLGFLAIAACVDPPLLMWMSIGLDWVIDALTGLWWTMLAIALAAFPDGRFTPRVLRWSLLVAPVLGIVLMLDSVDETTSLLIGVGVPLLLLAAQVIRYRRLEPGHARQQIKWAALGFAAGFLAVGVALAMSLAAYDQWSATPRGAWLLATVCLFNLGFAIMPLGLLVSVIRYRLWDVDQIISRSVAYTAVTSGIVLLWTLLSDVAKQLLATLMGPGNAMLGLALGAIVATSVFVPTQRAVLQWSKRRFTPASVDLERLPVRLTLWRDRCDAPELAARVLDVALRALHASAGAVFARTPTGRSLLARRSLESDDVLAAASAGSDGARALGGHVLHLEDEDGMAGWLILMPRDDQSRFPRSELQALAAAAGPIAQALRAATRAQRPEAAPRQLVDELRERLERLEQGNPSAPGHAAT